MHTGILRAVGSSSAAKLEMERPRDMQTAHAHIRPYRQALAAFMWSAYHGPPAGQEKMILPAMILPFPPAFTGWQWEGTASARPKAHGLRQNHGGQNHTAKSLG
jgi:hypothetical protein